jgi:NAD(P)-dependent dehydrogenase (short-subunit alcohol dehydrogenase family)
MMRSLRAMMDLRGRRALVTGGAGHLALAACEALIELGAKVAVLDKDEEACAGRARVLNRRRAGAAFPWPCDLSDEAGTRRAVRDAARRMGGLDILIHTAAYVGTTKSPGWAVPFSARAGGRSSSSAPPTASPARISASTRTRAWPTPWATEPPRPA